MQAQILNTENNQIFVLAYLPLELEFGAIESTYTPADIPQRVAANNGSYGAIASWQGTAQRGGSIQLTLDGADTRSRIAQLQNLCKPVSKKNSPPVCVLRLGAMEPVSVVITSVRPVLNLARFDRSGSPTRARVTVDYLPVDAGAIA